MKIVCDNCSAKYSIADEKVAGKVFKIRCKKCTNVIVVRGDQLAAAEEEEAATQVFDYGSDQVWHVVVDGDQQGPFAPLQLGMMITEGTIDWEAYVWKEGFDGWKPARDVPELVTAISGEQPDEGGAAAAAAGAAAGGAAAGGMGDDPFAGGGDDPFAGGGDDAFAGGGAEAPAADPGADLFAGGGEAASPFGGDEAAGGDDDVVASPSPRVSQEQAMTGARNENSVLFSLSNLQALATGDGGGGGESASPAPAASGPAPGHASGEGSGLIDIRALASATAATGGGGSGGASGGGGGGADDLLSIGGSGGIGSSLGAPVLAPAAPEPEEGNKKMLVIFGVVGLLVVGLLVALIVVLTREPAPVAQAGAPGANTEGPGTPEMPATAAADPNGTNPATMNAGQPVTGTMAEEADDEGDEGDEGDDEADEGDDEGDSSGRRSRRRRRRGGSTAMTGGSTAMSDPEPAAMTRMSNGSIDDLLDQAIGGGGGMSSRMAAAMSSSNLPAQPGRNDVASALRGVSSRVAGCGNGTSGVANARITFASSGRVSSVRVTGVPPAVQSCVSRGVRSARVPPFSRSSFNVNYPFRVR